MPGRPASRGAEAALEGRSGLLVLPTVAGGLLLVPGLRPSPCPTCFTQSGWELPAPSMSRSRFVMRQPRFFLPLESLSVYLCGALQFQPADLFHLI